MPFGVDKWDFEKPTVAKLIKKLPLFTDLRFTALFKTEIFFQLVAPNCNVARNVYTVTAECAVDLGSVRAN